MVEIGNGVAVDSPDKPSVFLIKGLGEIRIQKGDTRINGVTPEQFKIMADYLQPKKVKDEHGSHNADVSKAPTGKARTTRSSGTTASKGHGYIA